MSDDKNSILDELKDKNIKIDLSVIPKLKEEEELGRAEGTRRLEFLEKLMDKRMSDDYREGFIQGYYEGVYRTESKNM